MLLAGTLRGMEERRGPWVRTASEVVYENPWIRVRHDRAVTPAGADGIYGVVEAHPAIGIVPVDAGGMVHLVGQYRYAVDAWSWEIPEGGAHPGEAPEDAARRELREETGLVAGRLTSLGTATTSNCFVDEVAHFFLAEDLDRGPADPDPTEIFEHRVVPFVELLGMIRSGEVHDAMTIIGAYRAAEVLGAR